MAHISVAEVQSWFTTNRLQLAVTDDLPEEPNIAQEVLSVLASAYDVSGWTEVSTTPALVRKVISARVAAVRYRKSYADQIDEVSYADWLDEWAMNLLEQILSGSAALLDLPVEEQETAQEGRSTVFWPTDQTAIAEPDDDAMFKIGMRF
jgi:hypothetical protein